MRIWTIFVIVRSNGQPLYVLSNAVDDINDGVTHIIRGQDGLANTPKQVLIYEALNAPLPQFAHMSLTLDPQKGQNFQTPAWGKRLAIHFLSGTGIFYPGPLVNFSGASGMVPGGFQRILLPRQNSTQAFSLEGISKNQTPFLTFSRNDPRFFLPIPKAINTNAHYLRTLPVKRNTSRSPGTNEKRAGNLETRLMKTEKEQWVFKKRSI